MSENHDINPETSDNPEPVKKRICKVCKSTENEFQPNTGNAQVGICKYCFNEAQNERNRMLNRTGGSKGGYNKSVIGRRSRSTRNY